MHSDLLLLGQDCYSHTYKHTIDVILAYHVICKQYVCTYSKDLHVFGTCFSKVGIGMSSTTQMLMDRSWTDSRHDIWIVINDMALLLYTTMSTMSNVRWHCHTELTLKCASSHGTGCSCRRPILQGILDAVNYFQKHDFLAFTMSLQFPNSSRTHFFRPT